MMKMLGTDSMFTDPKWAGLPALDDIPTEVRVLGKTLPASAVSFRF